MDEQNISLNEYLLNVLDDIVGTVRSKRATKSSISVSGDVRVSVIKSKDSGCRIVVLNPSESVSKSKGANNLHFSVSLEFDKSQAKLSAPVKISWAKPAD